MNNTPLYKGARFRAAPQRDGEPPYNAFCVARSDCGVSPTSPSDTARANSADA